MNRNNSRQALLLENRKRQIKRLIKEEVLMIERNIVICDIVADEERRMLSEGYTRDQINEGIMDFLGKIPNAFGQYLKQYFIEMVLNFMKIDTNSIFGYFLKNTLQNMEFTNITKYFGKGGCRPLTDAILMGVQEGLSEKGLDMIVEKFFGRRMEGVFSGTAREALMDMLEEMTTGFRKPLEDFICNMNFSKLTSGLGGMFKGILPGSKSGAKGAGGDEVLSKVTDILAKTGSPTT